MVVFSSKSEPAGFKVDKFLVIQNYPAAGGVSASGAAYINQGALLFKFYSFHDDVRIGIRLTDSGRVPRRLDMETEIEVERNGGEQFVLFDDFPESYTKDNVHCYFELRLTNAARKDSATTVNVQLMFRPLALDIKNLQVLCGDCNHGKGNWDSTDWRNRQPAASEEERAWELEARGRFETF